MHTKKNNKKYKNKKIKKYQKTKKFIKNQKIKQIYTNGFNTMMTMRALWQKNTTCNTNIYVTILVNRPTNINWNANTATK